MSKRIEDRYREISNNIMRLANLKNYDAIEVELILLGELIKKERKQAEKEFLELIETWSRESIFKYESDCPYCQRNINDWIIKVKELKQKIGEENGNTN